MGIVSYNTNKIAFKSLDPTTGAHSVLTYAHKAIHNGNHFVCFHSKESPSDGEKINMCFKIPEENKRPHLFLLGSSAGASVLRIIENPSITDNSGSSLSIFNRRRENNNVSIILDISTNPDTANQVAKDVTFSNGTTIYEEYFGSDKDAGGQSREDYEFVLKSEEEYIIEAEVQEAGLAYINIIATWYELEDL